MRTAGTPRLWLSWWGRTCTGVDIEGLRQLTVDLHEEKVEQPEAGSREPGELVFEVVVRLLLQAELLQSGQGGALGPDGVVGSAQQVYHELQLVYLGLARQERLVGEQLAKDAATAPHVNCWREIVKDLQPNIVPADVTCGLSPGVQQQLRGSVPQSHNFRGHRLQGQTVVPRQPEVSDLDASFVSHQQVGDLEVSVNNEVGVEIFEAAEDLFHDTFDLRLREGSLHVVQKRGEILFAVEHHQEHGLQAAAHGDLLHGDNVLVVARQEDRDLPQTGHRDTVLLPLHPHLLQGHDLAGVGVPSSVHDAVGSLTDSVELFKLCDEPAASKLVFLRHLERFPRPQIEHGATPGGQTRADVCGALVHSTRHEVHFNYIKYQ